MKFTTLYLEGNKIELFNSIIGKETIKVNGEIVSSKFSITGTEHNFQLTENETQVNCKIVIGFGLTGVVIDFYKNDKPIIESPKSGCVTILFIVFIGGFVIGLLERMSF